MDTNTLVTEQLEAGEQFVREFNEYIPIAVAFWINPEESEFWYLYIASPEIRSDTLEDTRHELWQRLVAHKNQWLDYFRVKLLNSSDPMAEKAREFRDVNNVQTPMPFQRTSIGGRPIKGAYIYPAITTANNSN